MRSRYWSIAFLFILGAAGCSGGEQDAENPAPFVPTIEDGAVTAVDLGKLAEDAVAETSAELNGQTMEAAAAPAESEQALEPGSTLDDTAAAIDDLANRTEQETHEAELDLSDLIEE